MLYREDILSIYTHIPEDTREIQETLRELSISPSKEIKVYLSSVGGRVDTTITIINLLRANFETVECHVLGPCYSAASILALAGTKLIMYPNTYLMFHALHTELKDYTHKQVIAVDSYMNNYEELVYKYCTPFLTKRECKKFMAGDDLYIAEDNAKSRITRHNKRKS